MLQVLTTVTNSKAFELVSLVVLTGGSRYGLVVARRRFLKI